MITGNEEYGKERTQRTREVSTLLGE